MLDLLRPIYEKTAAYGHFGREEPEFTLGVGPPRANRQRATPSGRGAHRCAALSNARGMIAAWCRCRSRNPSPCGRCRCSPACCPRWPATWPGLRALAPLGIVAGIALALYGAFLGTEGAVYRLLRQYGTVVYFGFTCLCMLIAGAAIERSAQATARPLPRLLQYALTALAVLLVLLGLVNALVGLWLDGEPKAQVENVAEWWGSLIFTLVFVALAAMWRRQGVQITLAERER
jgi:hypothetical protein